MSLTKATFSMIESAPISVSDFGAVGDGDYTTGTGTDNRAAIQAAYDYCVANGKSLHLPAGSYRCIGRVYFGDIFTPSPEPLFDANGVTVYGDGRDTIIWCGCHQHQQRQEFDCPRFGCNQSGD